MGIVREFFGSEGQCGYIVSHILKITTVEISTVAITELPSNLFQTKRWDGVLKWVLPYVYETTFLPICQLVNIWEISNRFMIDCIEICKIETGTRLRLFLSWNVCLFQFCSLIYTKMVFKRWFRQLKHVLGPHA